MPRILLVDNCIDPCNALADSLRTLNYSVDCAYDGASAIDRLGSIAADLVILNVIIHRLDGWLVLQWIRAHPARANVPVIIHSDLSDSHWQLAQQMGANELWKRESCTFEIMRDSLSRYFQPRSNHIA